jgi:hypothetical protein
MSAELAPRRGEGAPPSLGAREAVRLALAALAASALFWSPLLLRGSLHGHDWSNHHFHYFDWVRIAFVEYGSLPLYMADAWVTPNFLGNAEAPTLGPLAWLLLWLPTGAYVKLLLVLTCAAGLAGGVLLLRDVGATPAAAALVACAYAWGGFFTSHLGVGHHWAMGGWLLPGLVCLYRRAALASRPALVAAAALNAFTILGGQHQPFIWQNLLLGAFGALWALRARALFPLGALALLWLLSAGLGAAKLLPMLAEFADYAPTAKIAGLPAAALLASLAGGGQDPETTRAGLAFTHGAGWWEYTFYVGPLALVALVAGAAAGRRHAPMLAIALGFLLLALEPASLWRLVEGLPVWRSQRAPSRFLLLALFALGVAAAPGLAELERRLAARIGTRARALAWLLVAFVALDLFVASLPWQRAATGPALASRDHRPRPLVVSGAGVRAELVGFAPNRFEYRIEASRPARVALPLRYGRRGAEWDAGGAALVERDGRLEVEVAAGETALALVYRPPLALPGAVLSALSFTGLLAACAARLRKRA